MIYRWGIALAGLYCVIRNHVNMLRSPSRVLNIHATILWGDFLLKNESLNIIKMQIIYIRIVI